MTYQVLARKWRPKDFASLVGQDHIVTALHNGLTEGRIAQAYLFSGIRGVGKTTAARVLAKALNCQKQEGPAADPCNECGACLEIGTAASLDVIEVDAATYSKVEQIRELTDTLRYGPAHNRYKVVVLDEVHRLSRQAFDALLKIVEEPPAHLVFIFATTEIDAVPATILSRCQEFQFRRVATPVLAAHLRRICDAEDIEVSDKALAMISRAGEGSVRDSVALLDQMATFGNSKIVDEEAQQLLGGLDSAVFHKTLGAILTGQHSPLLEVVTEIQAAGWDPHHVYGQFLLFVREALHLAMGGTIDSVDLPGEEAETLQKLVKPVGYEGVLQVLQLLMSSEPMVRRSEFGVLALEIAWLRAAELPKVIKIQEILSAQGGDPSRSVPPTREVRSESSRPPARSVRGATDLSKVQPSPTSVVPSSAETVLDNALDTGVVSDETKSSEEAAASEVITPPDANQIPDLLEVLTHRRPSLAALFTETNLSIRGNQLIINPPSGDSMLASALSRKGPVTTLNDAIAQIWGAGISWNLDANSIPSGPAPIDSFQPPPEEKSQAQQPPPRRRPAPSRDDVATSAGSHAAVAEQPVVKSVLRVFGGKVLAVRTENEESL